MSILNGITQDFSLSVSQDVWQNQTDVYIFAFTTEVTGKTIFELEDENEGYSMTICVRTSSGKTISIKCDRNKKQLQVSEGKLTRPSEDALFLRKEIIDALKRSDEKTYE